MKPINPGWGPKFRDRAMPLRLNMPDGYFAEVVVAPINKQLPFGWAAYAPDGRAQRGSGGSTLVCQERAEEAIEEMRKAA